MGTTSCPECFAGNVESLLVMRDDRQDDSHLTTISKFRCPDCGCQFNVIERYEIETEITKHSKEAEQ